MTDSHAALMLDRALDGERGLDLYGSRPLLDTAGTVQDMFDRQKGIPSEAFVLELERLLAPAEIVATVGAPAPAPVMPVIRPKSRSGLGRHRASHVLAAIAAALLLLLGGAGAIVFDGLGLGDESEPSSIPAIGFGTVEAADGTPEGDATPVETGTVAADTGWVVSAPEGIADTAEMGSAHAIADGRIVRAFDMKNGSHQVQAVDADSGTELWVAEIESSDVLMDISGPLLLLAEPTSNDGSPQLVGLDVSTGEEVWAAPLSDTPVALLVTGKQAVVLGASDQLDVVDLGSGQKVYAVDIGGDAANLYPLQSATSRINELNENRMAVDGETLYATLADGSVVAVDLRTGTGKWWSLRQVPGDVQIYVIDGAVVAVDNGDQDAIKAQFDAEVEAARSGTPISATPVVLPKETPSCSGMRVAATPSTVTVPGAVITVYKGLDPRTGSELWSTELPAQSIGQVAVDSGILYEVWATADWPNDRAHVSVCVVDPQTGEAQQIDPLKDFPGQFFLFERSSNPSTTSIGIVLSDNQMFFVPASYAPDLTGPVVMLDETFSDGWWWNELYDGAIYLSQIDGDLVKIPVPEN